jgi:3-deoxy-D-manno-octulosonic-acid transferase
MAILYDLAIRFYYFIILLVSPFNPKARLWLSGRKHLFERLRAEIDPEKPLVWFHASSLGEFEQGRPVIEAFREKRPDVKILLTFFSPSGYEIRKNYQGADYIFYLPLDTRKNAQKFVKLVKPQWVVFIKYDFWYNLLSVLSNKGIGIYLISAKFRSNQAFFKFYGFWYKKLLTYFNHLFVQDQESVNLLLKINIDQVTLTGDTRFDRVVQIAANSKPISSIEKFTAGKFVIVCGSSWGKDEELIARYIENNNFNPSFIIAPHEINTGHIRGLQDRIHKNTILFSEMATGKDSEAEVLIIDNIGMLSSLYRYGQLAYIGGGFGAGIHNILEAAVYGIPVIFGPNYSKFREASELIALGGAFTISTYDGLENLFNTLQKDNDKLRSASTASKLYVNDNVGSTEKILNYLEMNQDSRFSY